MDLSKKLLDSAENHFKSQISGLEANLMNLLHRTAGIGEHVDIMAEVFKLFEEIGAKRDGLNEVELYRNDQTNQLMTRS